MADKKIPFLCVITPVFDDCLESFKVLVHDIRQQSFNEFVHVSISDGESPKIKAFIESVTDDRFKYVEIKIDNALKNLTDIPKTESRERANRFFSIMQRRNYGIHHFEAVRYLFLDADLKLQSTKYFQTLYEAHQTHPSRLLLTKIRRGIASFLPRLTFRIGDINVANYCFTKPMAKTGYPLNYDPLYPYANDYRFFQILKAAGYVLLDFVSATKDGNKHYKNLQEYT